MCILDLTDVTLAFTLHQIRSAFQGEPLVFDHSLGDLIMRRRPTGNRNFRPTARRVHRANRMTVMRGGIRF